MATDTVYEHSKSTVNEPTVGQVRLALRKFRDYGQDLLYADFNTFEDRTAVFLKFCRTDPVFSGIREQLVSNPHVNFKEWEKESLASGTGWVGSCKLNFPTEEDDRLSLLFQ